MSCNKISQKSLINSVILQVLGIHKKKKNVYRQNYFNINRTCYNYSSVPFSRPKLKI